MNQTIIPFLSVPRFDRFLSECHGDPDEALLLYEWDLKMSGAAHEAMHVVEIVLRNGIDRQLTLWNQKYQNDSDWLLNPHYFLRAVLDEQGDLTKAVARANKALRSVRNPRHEDVLAQMSFGSWRFLLPSSSSPSKLKIWDESLINAFPHWYGDGKSLVEMVDQIYKLRNRIAHLEPIYREKLRARRKQMLNLVKAMDRPTHAWFIEQERMLAVIEARPEAIADATPV